MSHSKPKVTIDLDEYQELLKIKETRDLSLHPLTTVEQHGRIDLYFKLDYVTTKLGELDPAMLKGKDGKELQFKFYIQQLNKKPWVL